MLVDCLLARKLQPWVLRPGQVKEVSDMGGVYAGATHGDVWLLFEDPSHGLGVHTSDTSE